MTMLTGTQKRSLVRIGETLLIASHSNYVPGPYVSDSVVVVFMCAWETESHALCHFLCCWVR